MQGVLFYVRIEYDKTIYQQSYLVCQNKDKQEADYFKEKAQ